MIDLHVHSTFSDGSFTPVELVDKAVERGLRGMALTDHDCTGGVGLFLAACEKRGLDGVSGVEISSEVKQGTMHMLGYFIRHGDPSLEDLLVKIRDGREIRNREILRRLNSAGLELEWSEVAAYAGEDVVGRPHFAQALVARGYVPDKKQAFDVYLAKGKPAYADRFRLSPAESIVAIRGAGGVPVLAHPFTLEFTGRSLKRQVAELVELGLQGIEVYYSEHSNEQIRKYLKLTRDFGLVATGGSDFHGEINQAVELGRGFGNLEVPDEILEQLKERRDSNAVIPAL